MATMAQEVKKYSPRYRWTGTRCTTPTVPLVSASNVDQELGWTREEFKKIGVKYALLPLRPRERLVPALHPQPRQPHPLRRSVPADPRPRRHPPDRLLGATQVLRGRLHDGARQGRHLPDEGSEGQEDRPLEEPEHHQERLVAHPGGAGHRADAQAERHDPRRRGDRGVPVPGRLVRQARDAGADGEPVRAVAQARPQARPGLPSAGDGAGEGRRRCDLHPEQGLPASPGGDGQVQGDRGPVQVSGLDPAGVPTSPPSSPAPT